MAHLGAHRQYRSFAGSRSRSANERFIEVCVGANAVSDSAQMFDTDTVNLPPPEFRPSWLVMPKNVKEKTKEQDIDELLNKKRQSQI